MKHLGIVAALSFSFISYAEAHSWYDPYCYNHRDCFEARNGEVQWTPEGYKVEGHIGLIPLNDKSVRDVPEAHDNGTYHICRRYDGSVRCLYRSRGGI